ncbi:hypothetical protein M9458_053936, partial [Cirrhinus mrigala]
RALGIPGRLQQGRGYPPSTTFIANFSQVSAPLTSLLQKKPKTITWTPAALDAFHQLKTAFCTTPILTHPDPNLCFVVEWKGEPPVLHPCAYFSKKLSPAEQNYDIGNQELLAIKLALEEWWHWLEGAKHLFEVITGHKNLQYLLDAKRLNPRQARCALFFTRFRFTVSYRPGHKTPLRREVQKGGLIYPPPSTSGFRRDPGTQAASVPSRSSRIAIGGPGCRLLQNEVPPEIEPNESIYQEILDSRQ